MIKSIIKGGENMELEINGGYEQQDTCFQACLTPCGLGCGVMCAAGLGLSAVGGTAASITAGLSGGSIAGSTS